MGYDAAYYSYMWSESAAADVLASFGGMVGRTKRVITVPPAVMKPVMWLYMVMKRLAGNEHGLQPVKFMDLQTINTFFRDEDLQASRQALHFGSGGIEQALRETVEACSVSMRR